MDDFAAAEAALAVIAGLGLDPDHLAGRVHRLCRHRAAGQQPATTEADQQQIQFAGLLDQFPGGRALPGHHVRMVVRRNQRQAAFGCQLLADGLAVLGIAVVEDHLAAIAARGFDLDCRRIFRHHDHSPDAKQPRRQGNRLRMVAGRERDHAAGLLFRGELRDGVVGATELERPHALEVLAFEEQLGAGQRIGRRRSQHRGLVGDATDVFMGSDNIGKGNGQCGHGRSSWGR